jgi:hypothetical protein
MSINAPLPLLRRIYKVSAKKKRGGGGKGAKIFIFVINLCVLTSI